MRSSVQHPPPARVFFSLLLLLAFSLVFPADVFSAGEVAPPAKEEKSLLKVFLSWVLFFGPLIPSVVLFLVAAGLDISISSRPKETAPRKKKASRILKVVAGAILGILLPIGDLPSNAVGETVLGYGPRAVLAVMGVFIGAGLTCYALFIPHWYKWWALYIAVVAFAYNQGVHPGPIFIISFFVVGLQFFRAIATGTVLGIDKVDPRFKAAYEEGEELDSETGGVEADESEPGPGKRSKSTARKKTGKKPAGKEAKKKTSSRKKSAKKRSGK